jgi:hypothetical protein
VEGEVNGDKAVVAELGSNLGRIDHFPGTATFLVCPSILFVLYSVILFLIPPDLEAASNFITTPGEGNSEPGANR